MLKSKKMRLCLVFFCTPFLLGYLVFGLFPTLYSLWLSFFDWNGIKEKQFIGLDNYINLLTKDPLFYKAMANTTILMAISIPLTIMLGMMLAYALFNLTKGKTFFQTVNFFPYITTPVAVGFIFSYFFDWQSGYINQLLVNLGIIQEPFYWLMNPIASKVIIILMMLWKGLGYSMTIYLAGMTSISPDIYEAARVDGARTFQIFRKITIPLLKNITLFQVITSIIGGLQIFDDPLLLYSGWSGAGMGASGGPENAALTVVWKFYNDAFKMNSKLGYGASITYVLFAVILIFSIISFKISTR